MKPYLTIGMATFDDFDGCYFSVQSLRMYQDPEPLSRCELVLVDNHPDSPQGKRLAKFLGWIKNDFAKVRYIPFSSPVGTTAPRQHIFDAAEGEAVLVMDSHVLLWPGALKRLLDYYDANPGINALLSGPMMYDDLKGYVTHMDDMWRGEMWGTWGADQQGQDLDSPPFEIPAMGLGLFSMRKDHWPTFNPHFLGFGGEEFYIHEKVRRKGGQCLCLPFLRWVHRFGRPEGVKYPLHLRDRIRNYVIGHQELGLPLERLRDHFVGGGKIPMKEWKKLVEDPINVPEPAPSPPPTSVDKRPVRAATVPSSEEKACPSPDQRCQQLEADYDRVVATPSDIYKHTPKLRELASKCEHVTEFGTRHGTSTVALLAGRPGKLISYDLQRQGAVKVLEQRACGTSFEFRETDTLQVDIEETDFLFIDSKHTEAQLRGELSRHADKVRKWIALHDTSIYGEKGEDGGPGLIPALKAFLIEKADQWAIVYHSKENHGFTILSRDKSEWPAEPILAWPRGYGPGTELKTILSSLGINATPNCSCRTRMLQMDEWGIAGCRQNRKQIIDWLREGAPKWSWVDKLKAATAAVTTGLAFSLNPADPYPGLVDEAIRRAETKATK